MSERAKQLYLQCLSAYQDYLIIPNIPKTVLGDAKKGIVIPSYFYDNYNVPAELLFRELINTTGNLRVDRIAFEHRLLRLVSDKKEYDERYLLPKIAHEYSTKKFDVYFEVYFEKVLSAPELFSKQLSMNGVLFEWCSKRTFYQAVSLLESGKGHSILNGKGFPGLYRMHRDQKFPKINNEECLHKIKAKVMATNNLDAVNLAATSFGNFLDCVNITQILGSHSYSLMGGSAKSKSAVVDVGVYLVKSDDGNLDIFWADSKRYELPKQSLNLTENKNKVKFLNNLLRAIRDDSSPVSSRIRQVVLEFAQAIDSENSNLRQLGFWRCLEVATRKKNENRKDRDTIKIFQNYHSETKHWQQQGILIHRARNDYVHQGVSSESTELNDLYLNWSQDYAEAALRILMYLYNNRKIWRTESDIDAFFDYYSCTDRELELAGKLLSRRNKSKK